MSYNFTFGFSLDKYRQKLERMTDKELKTEYEVLKHSLACMEVTETTLIDLYNYMEIGLHDEISRRFCKNV